MAKQWAVAEIVSKGRELFPGLTWETDRTVTTRTIVLGKAGPDRWPEITVVEMPTVGEWTASLEGAPGGCTVTASDPLDALDALRCGVDRRQAEIATMLGTAARPEDRWRHLRDEAPAPGARIRIWRSNSYGQGETLCFVSADGTRAITRDMVHAYVPGEDFEHWRPAPTGPAGEVQAWRGEPDWSKRA